MLIQQNTLWRTKRAKRSVVLNNTDMTNAFACSDWEEHDQTVARDLFNEGDVDFAKQRYRWASVSLPCFEGQCNMRIGCGAFMGDPFAVAAFGHNFRKHIYDWNIGHYELFGKGALELSCRHPVDNDRMLDMSLTKYADDLVNAVIGDKENNNHVLVERVKGSLDWLDCCLEPGYAQNRCKLKCLVQLNGKGAQKL